MAPAGYSSQIRNDVLQVRHVFVPLDQSTKRRCTDSLKHEVKIALGDLQKPIRSWVVETYKHGDVRLLSEQESGYVRPPAAYRRHDHP